MNADEYIFFLSSSSLIGVATEKEKRKIFGDSSSRSISFLHTERMLGDERPQLGEREAVNGGGRNLAESRSGVEGGRSNVRHDEATSEESAGPIEEVVQVCLSIGVTLLEGKEMTE